MSRILWVICFGLPPPGKNVFEILFVSCLSWVGQSVATFPQLHTPVEQRGYQEVKAWPFTRIMTLNMRAPKTAAHFNAAGSAGFYGAILSQDNQKLAQLSLEFLEKASGNILKMLRWPLIWPEPMDIWRPKGSRQRF